MIYRLATNMYFRSKIPPEALFNSLVQKLPEAITINPGSSNEEKSRILLEQCFHDEAIVKPCIMINELSSP